MAGGSFRHSGIAVLLERSLACWVFYKPPSRLGLGSTVGKQGAIWRCVNLPREQTAPRTGRSLCVPRPRVKGQMTKQEVQAGGCAPATLPARESLEQKHCTLAVVSPWREAASRAAAGGN